LSLVLAVLVGCGKVTTTDGGTGGAGGSGGTGRDAGAGGSAGSGGAGGGGQGGAVASDGGLRCGTATCAAGEYCSNCNVCCPVGALCVCPGIDALAPGP
jgi:hypothetical protein